MGTKDNPGEFDCYDKALSDEPIFVLLARDPTAPLCILKWIGHNVDTISDEKLKEAFACYNAMKTWRMQNLERVKDNSGPATTLYDDGKDAEFFEGLDNTRFADELRKLAQDLCGDQSETYMPIVAILDSAADRIACQPRLSPDGTYEIHKAHCEYAIAHDLPREGNEPDMPAPPVAAERVGFDEPRRDANGNVIPTD